MIFAHVMFYIFSVLAILLSLGVVLSGNAVHSALFLVGTFVCMAAVWIILHVQFLGLILVLVYVGAVMTLFLFVVMMLNVQEASRERRLVRFLPVAAIVAVLTFLLILMAVLPRYFGLAHYLPPAHSTYNSVQAIGRVLYTHYLFPFELAGAILLVGMVAAISLAHRAPRDRKNQNPSEQVRVRKKDRLRVVNMKSEKPND